MTVKWERFAGSTDTFAARIAFMPDPDAGAAASREAAASWGAFQLWVDGQNLCAHLDQGEVLQSAHWYLLSLLEWLVGNWNALLHEEKLPNRNSAEAAVSALEATRNAPALAGEAETIAWEEERYEWRGRHALSTARSGGLFPNVIFRRLRDLIEISWNDESVAGTPDGFRFSSTRGAVLISPEQVAAPLYEVISAAASYLAGVGGEDRVARLQSEMALLSRPDQLERRLDWLAGLREMPPMPGRLQGKIPEHEMHLRWSEIVAALESSGNKAGVEAALAVDETPLVVKGSCHAALLFGSLSPMVTRADVRTLASILIEQYTASPVTMPDYEQAPLDLAVPAWEQGYDLADITHARLKLDLSDGWVDVEAVLNDLGVNILYRKLEDPNIRACCIIGPNHIPTIVHNEGSSYVTSSNAQRFSLAHELCHLLFDRSHGQKLAIASGPWAPRAVERRANAFAAMFLMPAHLVERAVADVGDPIGDMLSISRVASRLRVSRRTAIDHLYNLTLMTESDRDDLLYQVKD